MTAFVALVLGLCLGIFVTRQCIAPGSTGSKEKLKEKKHQSASLNESSTASGIDDIHKYSVTTISSSTCEKTDEFNQIQPFSLPPQFSRHSIASTSSQPLSLNPHNLEQTHQR